MLHDAQVNPSVNILQAIDRVLEILQTTELFVPPVHQVKEEDPLTNDYVGGLCDVCIKIFIVLFKCNLLKINMCLRS